MGVAGHGQIESISVQVQEAGRLMHQENADVARALKGAGCIGSAGHVILDADDGDSLVGRGERDAPVLERRDTGLLELAEDEVGARVVVVIAEHCVDAGPLGEPPKQRDQRPAVTGPEGDEVPAQQDDIGSGGLDLGDRRVQRALGRRRPGMPIGREDDPEPAGLAEASFNGYPVANWGYPRRQSQAIGDPRRPAAERDRGLQPLEEPMGGSEVADRSAHDVRSELHRPCQQRGGFMQVRLIWSLLILAGFGCARTPSYDVVIRGGTIVDGTGRPGRPGDLAIRHDSIVAVGAVSGTARQTIDAKGLVVAPGFFDLHSHSEYDRLQNGLGPSFALQGITTEIYGENTSMGPLGGKLEPDHTVPGLVMRWTTLGGFLDTLERRGNAANFGSYLGTGTVRAFVVGYDNRPPTPAELDSMRSVVRHAMAQGALGVSSGLSYAPNIYATTGELVALAREAAKAGGIYASHIRTINGKDPNAVREAVTIADSAGIAVHLFHLNSVASVNAKTFLAIMDSARARGVKITGDAYTYTWGITGLADYLPSWVLAGGTDSMLARLANRSLRKRISWGFQHEEPFYALVGWDKVRLGVEDKTVNAKLVSEVAKARGISGDDAYMDVVLAAKGTGLLIDWNNDEATLREVLKAPYVAGGTDGMAIDLETEKWPLLHPRLLGTFPRWLGRYVRDEKLMTLEEAVRRLTSLAASITGLTDRGKLEPGLKADVVVFDPATIIDHATFEDPNHYSEGVQWLLVNGVPVVAEGKPTGAKPGRALRGKGYRR